MNELARHLAVKPLTAVLVRPERLSDLPALHREYNLHPDVQAVFPSAVLLTVFNILSLVEEILTYVLAVMALVVLLYVGVALYTATPGAHPGDCHHARPGGQAYDRAGHCAFGGWL